MANKAKPARTMSALARQAIEIAEANKARLVARLHAQRASRSDAEAHRQRGLARLQAATDGGATRVLRLDITNVLSGNDYSAQLTIGKKGAVANVLLDTGSSTLAVEPAVYSGVGDRVLKSGTLLQHLAYDIGGWAGPVVNTRLTLGRGARKVALPDCPIAITSVRAKGTFKGVTGIMGLAYNGLDLAHDFKSFLAGQGKTSTYPWPFGKRWNSFNSGFSALLIEAGAGKAKVKPYFDQVEEGGVVANKFAFYTLRSRVSLQHGTRGAADDPLNKGYFILGGGEEQKDLYTGDFLTVKVLHKLYYNTNLKSVRVEGCDAHKAAPLQQRFRGALISNSIVDSGTNHLTLAKDVFEAILRGLKQRDPAFIRTINAAAKPHKGVSVRSLELERWPNIHFTLAGENGRDVELTCTPQTYWQIDFPRAGQASFQIKGPPFAANQSVLGLPLMNNYYTVFDRSRDLKGVIRFARIKPPRATASKASGAQRSRGSSR